MTLTRKPTLAVPGGIIAVVLSTASLTFANPASSDLAELGRALFFDARLSANGNQSCSSCHDPSRAFSGARDNGVAGAASLGDDGVSLGDRNAPSLSYASLTPDFHQNADGKSVLNQ